MYNLINNNINAVLDKIDDGYHLPEYDWLLQNVTATPRPGDFERRYRKYWVMNAARLCDGFYTAYFEKLDAVCAAATVPSPSKVCLALHPTPSHSSGRQSLQFSFSTKLCHMAEQTLPIYDSLVADFFFYQAPATDKRKSAPANLAQTSAFYDWLCDEYRRVLAKSLLGPAIAAFRVRCSATSLTDTKIIDSLIWAFVVIARQRRVTYV